MPPNFQHEFSISFFFLPFPPDFARTVYPGAGRPDVRLCS